jgi:hypothetical protein
MTNNLSSIIDALDSRQKEAVCCTEGPVLIVAGAGSGKTRVLTSKIAYMVGSGCDPSMILALTFTKKAAEEMKGRIADFVGRRDANRIYMGTFHSVFIRFLREYSDKIGFPSSFTIFDTSDSQSAIKHIVKEMKLDDSVYKPKDVLSRISMAKNNLVTVEAYKGNRLAIENDRRSKKPEICNIYAAYQAFMKKSGVMDFDDILLNMNILLRDYPEVCEEISSRFRYILVDEYQDTNYSQYLILKKLCLTHNNICVVGDDSQSIYAFRGAKIENILNFRKDYPDTKIFRLERNYRSTQSIVNAANSLIEKNEGRIPKKCFSEGEEGAKIHLIKAYTEQEEATLIASSIISSIQSEHSSYKDYAVLYRTNYQSRAIEEAFRKRNIPYLIYSGNSFFDRAEVKDMMSYFKLAVNPNDDESFRRSVNKPARGIGATSIEALMYAARQAGTSLLKAAYLDNLESFGLKQSSISKIRAFADMIMAENLRINEVDAYESAMNLVNNSGLYRFFKEDNSVESQSRASNIEELVNSVKSYIEDRQNEMREEIMAEQDDITTPEMVADTELSSISLGDYLENISLLSAVDVEDDEDSTNKVALMTVHSSKGLEFSHVYVAGMEENIFPSGGSYATPSEIEEERRLFYVALTRAMSSVNLTFANSRMRNGKHESNAPSRFIREIDKAYIDNPLIDNDPEELYPNKNLSASITINGLKFGMSSGAPIVIHSKHKVDHKKIFEVKSSKKDENFVPVSVYDLKEGQIIEHSRFGIGEILSISGRGDDLKAIIKFNDYGNKMLILKYAKIRFPKNI